MVFSGLVTAWRLATSPTRRSPLLLTATMDGVVRAPSALGMTTGSPPSITATHELVVPRSIPITFDTVASYLLFLYEIGRDASDLVKGSSDAPCGCRIRLLMIARAGRTPTRGVATGLTRHPKGCKPDKCISYSSKPYISA